MCSSLPIRLITTTLLVSALSSPLLAEEAAGPAAVPVAPPVATETPAAPKETPAAATAAPRSCRVDTAAVAAAPIERVRPRVIFALDLLEAVAGDSKASVAVSPSGVAAVLSTLDLGADDAMRKAIAKTLRLGTAKGAADQIRADARLLAVAGTRPGAPFATADGLFVDQRLTLMPGIEDRVEAASGIAIKKVDFASPAALAEIDKWASDRTQGRISKIMEPGSSPSLVAIDAFVFKDCWRIPFDPSATAPRPFHRLDGSTVDRPTMMLDEQTFRYAGKGRFAALELPYGDPRFILTLMTTTDAPAAPKAFEAARDLLAGEGLKPTAVRLAVPKFTGAGEHDLLSALAKMGLASGLSSKTQLAGFASGIALSAVRQKTVISIDETGTEAASVTVAETTRGLKPGPSTVKVEFNRPFVYALRHRETGTIVMTGWVADPEIVAK
ncbi:serpin family protein [Rhodoplanes sp. SY1]|uniref:serpin family protein n=1 Tax=Rhodoplanes sp. SY1 TaxID=3166646 RepID=UPI0038B5EB83